MKNNELIIAVLAQLEREGTVSVPQLSQLLNCPEKQIAETLELLVYAYDVASIRLDLHETHASLVSRRPERLLRLTPGEADVLVDVLQNAGFKSDDELVRKILETKTLLEHVNPSSTLHVQTVSANTLVDVTQALSSACEDEDHHLVRIGYQGENDERVIERDIEPTVFFSRDGRRYLLAYCLRAQGWRSFRIDRIKSVAILEKRYNPRDDIPSIKEEFQRSIIKAHVRFASGATIPAWHGMRTVKTLEDGAKVMSIDWVGSMWLPKHIVAQMGAAVPLDPPELVEACKHFARSLSQK